MSEPLYALLYQSNAVRHVGEDDLDEIHRAAAARNEQLDVTGLLLYGHVPDLPQLPGVFVQWLEGRREDVLALYAAIRTDPRHRLVETIAEGPAADVTQADGRLFPDWAMDVRRMAEVPATLAGFLDYARSDAVGAARS